MHISGAEWIATKWMYNNLTRLNVKREVVPDLAESWAAADNGRVWTFKLRQGAKFHIGREVTADDVVATIQTLLDPKVASPYRGEIGPVDRVEAVDKHTVRFTLKAPYADFPALMTIPNARIVARERLQDVKGLAAKEFGSGPFKLKEFVPGDHLAVERFTDYYRKGLPYLDSASIKVFPEPSTELTAFKSKEIDMIWDVTPDLYSQVATLAGVDAMAVRHVRRRHHAGRQAAVQRQPRAGGAQVHRRPEPHARRHPRRPRRARPRPPGLLRLPVPRPAPAARPRPGEGEGLAP
jgi:peptide/nickel transport system substrate-binding protein